MSNSGNGNFPLLSAGKFCVSCHTHHLWAGKNQVLAVLSGIAKNYTQNINGFWAGEMLIKQIHSDVQRKLSPKDYFLKIYIRIIFHVCHSEVIKKDIVLWKQQNNMKQSRA